jgi:hypothetical protein
MQPATSSWRRLIDGKSLDFPVAYGLEMLGNRVDVPAVDIRVVRLQHMPGFADETDQSLAALLDQFGITLISSAFSVTKENSRACLRRRLSASICSSEGCLARKSLVLLKLVIAQPALGSNRWRQQFRTALRKHFVFGVTQATHDRHILS